jgi:DNA-binding MarR family transcriptional regulator
MSKAGPGRASPAADRVGRLLQDWRRERPDLDVSAMAVVGRLLHLGRVLEARASRVLKPFGINYTDLDVLATLRRYGKPYELTPTALCDSVLVTSGTMTVCLDRLTEAGLVERRASRVDRRSRAVALTAAGRRLVDQAIAVRFAEAKEAVAALSARERGTLARALERLGRGLGE